MNIYGQQTYRGALQAWIAASPSRGIRSRIAQAARCSPSWITRVLNGNVQLTPDQALGIAGHFGLEGKEADYFLLLVDFERAASPAMKKRIQEKLEGLRAESLVLHASIRSASEVDERNAGVYYSSWTYAAVHVACMIRPFSGGELAARFGLTERGIARLLASLKEMGLVAPKAGKWAATSRQLHLPATSALVNPVHRNWRLRTARLLEEPDEKGLHYSAVHCLSRKDAEKIRRLLKEGILEARRLIESSPSETLAVFCVDWFEI